MEALFLAVGHAGKGVVLITAGKQCTYADVYEWQPRVGRPFTYPLFARPDGAHLETVELHEIEQLMDTDPDLSLGGTVFSRFNPQSKGYVFKHAHVSEQSVMLKNEAHVAVAGRAVGYVLVHVENGPAVCRLQTGNDS